jgi:hypothetical protein
MSEWASLKRYNLQQKPVASSQQLLTKLSEHPRMVAEAATVSNCIHFGYAPKGYSLADFSILKDQGVFHVFHIPRIPNGSGLYRCHEHWLGHAISTDLDTWHTLDPVLCSTTEHYYESAHVWAPFLMKVKQQPILFYTGLSAEPSQTLCAAHAVDTNLVQWKKDSSNPLIPLEGFDWHYLNQEAHVRHARDPHVVAIPDGYLLAYTGMHKDGCPVVGGMVSVDLVEWVDIGPILYRPLNPATWLPESVNIQPLEDGTWVLIPSQSPGLTYYISEDPLSWHGKSYQSIRFLDGDDDDLYAIEVIDKTFSPDRWLVAFFRGSTNRMFFGWLELKSKQWTIQLVKHPAELEPILNNGN